MRHPLKVTGTLIKIRKLRVDLVTGVLLPGYFFDCVCAPHDSSATSLPMTIATLERVGL